MNTFFINCVHIRIIFVYLRSQSIMIDTTTKLVNIMVKLSERFVRVATAIAERVGEDFGFHDDVFIPSSAKYYFTSICRIEACERTAFCMFAYSLWIDDNFFYFCIDTAIYKCRRSLHNRLCVEEIAAFIYLVFCKHQFFYL